MWHATDEDASLWTDWTADAGLKFVAVLVLICVFDVVSTEFYARLV